MSNIIAFPTDRSSPRKSKESPKSGWDPKTPRTPDVKISQELIELAALNRRLIALTDFLGQRLTEQERRLQSMEKRLLQLAKDVYEV